MARTEIRAPRLCSSALAFLSPGHPPLCERHFKKLSTHCAIRYGDDSGAQLHSAPKRRGGPVLLLVQQAPLPKSLGTTLTFRNVAALRSLLSSCDGKSPQRGCPQPFVMDRSVSVASEDLLSSFFKAGSVGNITMPRMESEAEVFEGFHFLKLLFLH